jgi:dipeptidyl-peptidase-4
VVTSQKTGTKFLTLGDLYDPKTKVDFEGKPKNEWRWSRRNHYFGRPRGKDSQDRAWRVGAIDRESAEPLYDVGELSDRVNAIDADDATDATDANDSTDSTDSNDAISDGSTERPEFVALSSDQAFALVTVAGHLYRYQIESGTAILLSDQVDSDAEPTFSPDGLWVTYIHENSLHLVAADRSASPRPLTDNTPPDILDGRLDWVYQEELYGRGNFNGYWWSPDSTYLAFLRLDVSKVARHTIASHEPSVADSGSYRYPRAGSPNPTARLGIFKVSSQLIQWIDFPEYQDVDHLIVNVQWSPDGKRLSCQVQDREQTWLDLLIIDPFKGSHETVLRETSQAWVGMSGPPCWFSDGSFVWISDRSGWSHLYHFDSQNQLMRPLTSGEWDVRELYGVQEGEEGAGWVYFAGTERGSLDLDTCRIRADGSGMERLTSESGTHQSKFSPDMSYFIDTWSTTLSPAQVHLHRSDGTRILELESCTAPSVSDYDLGSTEHFRVPVQIGTSDEALIEAMMIKPPDFDPNRKYPVLCYVYGGPGTPVVRNGWGGATYMWHHMLAQRGCIIWMVDSRAASAKGMRSVWSIYRNFGVVELRDLEDSIGWLKGQRYVDPDRIGIWGWSFGGYLTAYAMTHSTTFRAGIAGAAVTDWALYDTIYTERYMQTPEHNPEGYRRSSVLESASDLNGKLLIVHGTADDNVHIENSMRLVRELQRAGKDFDLMVYPGARHGIEDAAQLYDLRGRMTQFITENL